MPDIPGPYCLAGGLGIFYRDGKAYLEAEPRPLTPDRARIIAHWLERWADEQDAANAVGGNDDAR
jgi:hypothetical protein